MQQAKAHPKPEPQPIREGFHQGTRVYVIPLTKGHEAIIEPADWQRIARDYGTRWAANIARGHVYARKAVKFPDGTIRATTLARAVLKAAPDERVTAGNGNALDLRRGNLTKKRFVGKVAQRRRRQHAARQSPAEPAPAV